MSVATVGDESFPDALTAVAVTTLPESSLPTKRNRKIPATIGRRRCRRLRPTIPFVARRGCSSFLSLMLTVINFPNLSAGASCSGVDLFRMRLAQPKQTVSLKNELRNRWTEAQRTGFQGITRSRLCRPLEQVTIPRRRHDAKERAGSFLKRPAVLAVVSRPKRTRQITFGGFEPLPPGTLPCDALESLFARRRLQNKSRQSPSLSP